VPIDLADTNSGAKPRGIATDLRRLSADLARHRAVLLNVLPMTPVDG